MTVLSFAKRPLVLILLILPVLALSACAAATTQATTQRPGSGTAAAPETPQAPEVVQAAAAVTRAPAPRPSARATAAQLNTTTAAQRAAAAERPAASGETRLGTTVASLGDATQPGFWIKTPLVKTQAVGRIVNPANGKSAKVDLIPLNGPASGGSQVSLPALQLLGISLTDLPVIEVFRS
ncbi:MAG: hypothetical protein Q4G22_10285 [Paracoccus sp. (in: a-proteobacteria)]|uniref:hypothetical protein n=1 Tax=Paracoccus sp. TaxID=267 RepID=UPI0026DEBF38|nr:hypothetical protein [Paracoccus sp. (in: a-proteobacteria)]MDO5632213.1 hypothetical protein [Paracoccus sp. (in: a-proteobacteria)]